MAKNKECHHESDQQLSSSTSGTRSYLTVENLIGSSSDSEKVATKTTQRITSSDFDTDSTSDTAANFKPYISIYEKIRLKEDEKRKPKKKSRYISEEKYRKLMNSDCFIYGEPVYVKIMDERRILDKTSSYNVDSHSSISFKAFMEKLHIMMSSTSGISSQKSLYQSQTPGIRQRFRKPYQIEVNHGEFSWVIFRHHGQFRQLHERIILMRLMLLIKKRRRKFQSIENERVSSSRMYDKLRNLPKLPFGPDVRGKHADRRKKVLEAYLQAIANISILRDLPEMLNFLEISRFSFIHRLGTKRKEGMIFKRCGDRRLANLLGNNLRIATTWRKRWLILKDSFIGYVRPGTAQFGDIMLIDGNFKVEPASSIGKKHVLRFSNLSRCLYIRCSSDQELIEWCHSVNTVIQTTGRMFIMPKPYESFAPVRGNVLMQWYVDGMIYYEAIANAIAAAKEEIFITGWWLTPELYMKRAVRDMEAWRLDNLLQRKANEGIRVFILLYKELETFLMLGSTHVINTLKHENIKIIRHPWLFTVGKRLHYTHHEKTVIIDQTAAFIGGIDLALGRWDTRAHDLTDIVLTNMLDRSGTNESWMLDGSQSKADDNDFQENIFDQFRESILNLPACEGCIKLTTTELPSHQVDSSRFRRNSISDVLDLQKQVSESSFQLSSRERQTYSINFKEGSERPTINSFFSSARKSLRFRSPATQEDNQFRKLSYTPFRELARDTKTKAFRRRFRRLKKLKMTTFHENPVRESCLNRMEFIVKEQEKIRRRLRLKNTIQSKLSKTPKSTQRAVVRDKMKRSSSSPDRSTEEEMSVLDSKATSEDLYRRHGRCSSAPHGLLVNLWQGQDYVNWIKRNPHSLVTPFKDGVDRSTVPRMPWHDIACAVYGRCARDVGRHFIERWNAAKREMKKATTNYPFLVPKSYADSGIGSSLTRSTHVCTAQVLRSASEWSAGISKIECSIYKAYLAAIASAEHFIYIENQYFISSCGDDDGRVQNTIADALYSRIMQMHKKGHIFRVFLVIPLLPAVEGTVNSWRGVPMRAILHYQLKSLCQGPQSLLGRLRVSLKDEAKPEKYLSIASLRNYSCANGALKTELIYVHSKLMIVDDTQTIIGSANVNDRSMLGDRDSEVAICIRDLNFVPSKMNTKVYVAGRFAHSLRVSLMCEHLGLNLDTEKELVQDPVDVSFFDDIWTATAALNTKIYEEVFRCYPSNEIKKLNEIRKFTTQGKLCETNKNEAIKKVALIKGHLVHYQVDFLSQENLSLGMTYIERIIPRELWT